MSSISSDEARRELGRLTRQQQKVLCSIAVHNASGPFRERVDMPAELGTWKSTQGRWYFETTDKGDTLGLASSWLGPQEHTP